MIGDSNAQSTVLYMVPSIVSATIAGVTGTWFKETYTNGVYRVERAVNMADPAEVYTRTSDDSGTTWTSWTYAYAVWKV